MAKFLLLGPSGIGKSTCLKILSDDPYLNIYDLDSLIKTNVETDSISQYFGLHGNKHFFLKSKEIIRSIKGDKNILIGVGAGSIDFIEGHEWYKDQNIIALVGDPDIIYNRSGREIFHPTLDDYKDSEFSPVRQKLYNSKHVIDVTQMSPTEVADKVVEIIKYNC